MTCSRAAGGIGLALIISAKRFTCHAWCQYQLSLQMPNGSHTFSVSEKGRSRCAINANSARKEDSKSKATKRHARVGC